MARPRSEEKQVALLESAVEIVASQGTGATTRAVAQSAGVAEGTLFRYFATKDVLLNEVYLYLKENLSDAMRAGFDPSAALEVKVQALWNGYVDWGIANASAMKALNQLTVSEAITQETKVKAESIFPEVFTVVRECAAHGSSGARPKGFVNAAFLALADITIQLAGRDPAQAVFIKEYGFSAFWKGLRA